MLGLILAVGVQVVTVGQFIERVESVGNGHIFAVGLDRLVALTEGDVVAIGAELGIHLTTEFKRREVDRVKVQYLVWLLTPDGKEKGRGDEHRGNGKGKKKGHSKCDPDEAGGWR